MSTVNSISVHPLTWNPNKAWDEITKKSAISNLKQPLVIDCELKLNASISETFMRVVCISDTHSRIETSEIEIPEGDIIIHAGDFSNTGALKQVRKFNDWLGSLPHKHKIVIAGNHELSFDPNYVSHMKTFQKSPAKDSNKNLSAEEMQKELSNCIYLQDSGVELYGIKIYGSPWQPEFGNWGFNLKRGSDILEKWNKIPDDTDILITHGPPLGYGDMCSDGHRVGCVELLNTVRLRVQPKYHIYGHIHEGYGVRSDGQITYINASICNVRGFPINKPFVFDIEIPKGVSKSQTHDSK